MRKDNLRRAYPYLIKSLNTCRFQLRNYIFLAFRSKKLHISDKKVSIIIPTLSKDEQSDHLVKLKRLLSAYLPQQSHKNYEAIVFCDGKNDMVENMVMSLKDTRIRLYFTENTLGKWGHPQTRLGVEIATGDFFVRMNDDNKPYKKYLETLINGFEQGTGIVYGRVIFKGEARKRYFRLLDNSFVIPRDKEGLLKLENIDCMNYMVRMNLAKKYVNYWSDDFIADFLFLEGLLKNGLMAKFIDEIIGEKF